MAVFLKVVLKMAQNISFPYTYYTSKICVI